MSAVMLRRRRISQTCGFGHSHLSRNLYGTDADFVQFILEDYAGIDSVLYASSKRLSDKCNTQDSDYQPGGSEYSQK